jgi:hypothetical protein
MLWRRALALVVVFSSSTNACTISANVCAERCSNPPWAAVPVCPPWQLTRPDADAAQAEPSPGTDLKSDPVRHGLAAQAPATGTAQGGREDQDVLRAASIDAIGLATGRWMYASTGRCERRARP